MLVGGRDRGAPDSGNEFLAPSFFSLNATYALPDCLNGTSRNFSDIDGEIRRKAALIKTEGWSKICRHLTKRIAACKTNSWMLEN